MVLEAKQRSLDFIDRWKLALIAHDPDRFTSVVFPEWMEQKATIATEKDLEDSEGMWRFGEDIDAKDAESILEQMVADSSGTMTMDDLDEDW